MTLAGRAVYNANPAGCRVPNRFRGKVAPEKCELTFAGSGDKGSPQRLSGRGADRPARSGKVVGWGPDPSSPDLGTTPSSWPDATLSVRVLCARSRPGAVAKERPSPLSARGTPPRPSGLAQGPAPLNGQVRSQKAELRSQKAEVERQKSHSGARWSRQVAPPPGRSAFTREDVAVL